MKLLILSLLSCLASADIKAVDWNKFTKLVPAKFREGNRYFIEVDNIGAQIILKPIAVYAHGKEIVYGEFTEDNPCVTFASYHTTIQKCDFQFFLLHANYNYFARKTLMQALSSTDQKACPIVGFGDTIIILVKYDVSDPNSPKSIGTYSRKRDAGYLVDHRGQKVSYRRLLDKIKKQRINGDKFDVLCRGSYIV